MLWGVGTEQVLGMPEQAQSQAGTCVCACGGGICASWPPLRDHKVKTQVGRRAQSPRESGQSLCGDSGPKGTSAGCDSRRLLRGGCCYFRAAACPRKNTAIC